MYEKVAAAAATIMPDIANVECLANPQIAEKDGNCSSMTTQVRHEPVVLPLLHVTNNGSGKGGEKYLPADVVRAVARMLWGTLPSNLSMPKLPEEYGCQISTVNSTKWGTGNSSSMGSRTNLTCTVDAQVGYVV